jgi:hypothetical protein
MVSDPYLKDPKTGFEWGVGYIPAITKETSPYASGTAATVIGGAAIQLHVTNSAMINNNVEECVDLLMFLSAPQNLQRLTSEALLFIPNVKGAEMSSELQPFFDIFQRRYCAIKWLESMDGRYKKHWRRMLDFYLNDGFADPENQQDPIGLMKFIAELDSNFTTWVAEHSSEPSWEFEVMEKVWKERESELLKELDPVQ